MNPTKALTRIQTPPFCCKTINSLPNIKRALQFHPSTAKFPVFLCSNTTHNNVLLTDTSTPAVASDHVSSGVSKNSEQGKLESVEVNIEKVIYGCRFFAILAVWGSLVGSFLCFIKLPAELKRKLYFFWRSSIRHKDYFCHIQGCAYVITSYQHYFLDRLKVIGYLVEATDVYLLGTVMLVFGMGLYELFISNLDKAKSMSEGEVHYGSNLFGLFTLKERPRWLEIKTVNELKTKLGHVIVMLLLIGLFDKSKKAIINSPLDLLCFTASVFLSSGCLYLLSKLNE
ncbi:hypothetical protein ACJIZ3_001789 [Penstemon smallii]|uniref:Uncharacterized protein n=1 Tax=Penstemon smallii TaxID=265156 RepID=A0ABD3U4M0_9LAMI